MNFNGAVNGDVPYPTLPGAVNGEDYELLEKDDDPKVCCCFGGGHKRAKCVGVVSLIIFVLLTASSLVLYYAFAPVYVTDLLKTSTLELTAFDLQSDDYTSMTGHLTSHGFLRDLPALPSVVSSASVRMGRAQVRLMESADDVVGTLIGYLSDGAPISAPVGGGDVAVSISSTLTVGLAQEVAFARFGQQLLYNKSVSMRLFAPDASVHLKVGSLSLSIGGVTVDKTTKTAGCEGLKGMVVDEFQVYIKNVTGKGERMNAVVQGRLWNPANVSANSGFVRTGLMYKGQDLGSLGGVMTLNYGWNIITVEGILLEDGGDEQQLWAMGEMNAQYMQGERINITTVARPKCSDLPIFSALLTSLILDTYLIGMRVGTIMESHIDLSSLDIAKMMPHCLLHPHDCRLPTAILFQNPFMAEVVLHSFNLQVMWHGKVVGNSQGIIDLHVPGNTSIYAPEEPVIPPSMYSIDVLKSLFSSLATGMIMLGAHGVVRIDIANLKIVSNYTQMENNPTCLSSNMDLCDSYKKCETCYAGMFFQLEDKCKGNETNMVATCRHMLKPKETFDGSNACMKTMLSKCYKP